MKCHFRTLQVYAGEGKLNYDNSIGTATLGEEDQAQCAPQGTVQVAVRQTQAQASIIVTGPQLPVMRTSCDKPRKLVTWPWLSLNICAVFDEQVFSWDEDENGYSTELYSFSMQAMLRKVLSRVT